MFEAEILYASKFAMGQRPLSTRMVDAVSVRSDTIGGSVAGVRLLVSFSCAVDVVVGPVGGDRSDGLVNCGPWF